MLARQRILNSQRKNDALVLFFIQLEASFRTTNELTYPETS